MRFYICGNCNNIIDTTQPESSSAGKNHVKCSVCMLVGTRNKVWQHTMKQMQAYVQGELERMSKLQPKKPKPPEKKKNEDGNSQTSLKI